MTASNDEKMAGIQLNLKCTGTPKSQMKNMTYCQILNAKLGLTLEQHSIAQVD